MRLLGDRPVGSAFKALMKPANYTGLIKMFAQCSNPVQFLRSYLTGSGSFPVDVTIRTPIGPVVATAFHRDDILTINEIFFRGDYGEGLDDKVVVDFGSNIGISALFFLSRNAECYTYCHEPLPQNIDRLKINLRQFAGRYELREAAVAEYDGTVSFGWEPTGRYGGVGKDCGATIEVPALDSNRVLAEIVARHGRIDLLKIDIETLERELTARIPADTGQNIRRIAIELPFEQNPLPATHDMIYDKPITTLRLRAEG